MGNQACQASKTRVGRGCRLGGGPGPRGLQMGGAAHLLGPSWISCEWLAASTTWRPSRYHSDRGRGPGNLDPFFFSRFLPRRSMPGTRRLPCVPGPWLAHLANGSLNFSCPRPPTRFSHEPSPPVSYCSLLRHSLTSADPSRPVLSTRCCHSSPFFCYLDVAAQPNLQSHSTSFLPWSTGPGLRETYPQPHSSLKIRLSSPPYSVRSFHLPAHLGNSRCSLCSYYSSS